MRVKHPDMGVCLSCPPRRRVSEKVVQQHVVEALRVVGAAVYVLGTVHAGEPGRMTTRMTPGIPDLYALLPESVDGQTLPHGLWVEVKGPGGRLRPAQAEFARRCGDAGVPHLVGGVEVVLAYLHAQGYIREYPGQHRRRA